MFAFHVSINIHTQCLAFTYGVMVVVTLFYLPTAQGRDRSCVYRDMWSAPLGVDIYMLTLQGQGHAPCEKPVRKYDTE